MSPIASIKAATAATDSPAICAGVILGWSSVALATGTELAVGEEVGDGNNETVSAKADGVELVGDCKADVMVVVGVIVATDCIEEGDAVRVGLVTT